MKINLAETFKQAIWNLAANRRRSFLTLFGIAWGIVAFVITMSFTEGWLVFSHTAFSDLGSNLIAVSGGQTSQQVGGRKAGRRVYLTYNDAMEIRHKCSQVSMLSAELIQTGLTVESDYNSSSYGIHGVESEYQTLRLLEVENGRLLNSQDIAEARRVCLIGSEVREQLFAPNDSPVENELRIKGIPYRIVGTMEEKDMGESYFGSDNRKVLIPLTAALRDMPAKKRGRKAIDVILLRPISVAEHDAALRRVRQILANRHHFDAKDADALSLEDSIDEAATISSLFTGFRIFFGTVGIVTIFIGSIGVMNIMLVSVTERTPEIGLLKAIGATRRIILTQFLLEAVFLTSIGGGIGMFFGIGLSLFLAALPLPPDSFAPPVISTWIVTSAVSIIGAVGIVSGFYPALRAARMTPVEALRYQ